MKLRNFENKKTDKVIKILLIRLQRSRASVGCVFFLTGHEIQSQQPGNGRGGVESLPQALLLSWISEALKYPKKFFFRNIEPSLKRGAIKPNFIYAMKLRRVIRTCLKGAVFLY